MKLVLKNRSSWDTGDLRKLLTRAAQAVGMKRGAIVRVVARDTRSVFSSGHAYYGNRERPGAVEIALPKKEVVIARAARVAHHLFLRSIGARARDMTTEQFRCTQDVPWAEGLELRPSGYDHEPDDEEEVMGEAYRDLAKQKARADKLAHATTMLKRADTRVKRAVSIQKKWQRKVRALRRPFPIKEKK